MNGWKRNLKLGLVAGIVACPFWWLLFCAFVTWELSFDRQLEYFVLAWTGKGFVKPALAWQLSLIATFVTMAGTGGLAWRYGRPPREDN
jgi:hypothetical protein